MINKYEKGEHYCYYKEKKLNAVVQEYKGENIYCETEYKDGKENGKKIFYYENGDIKREIEYKNGKKNGFYIEYGQNKNILIEEMYKDDK